MKRLGGVGRGLAAAETTASAGSLVVRAEFAPPVGADVLDKRSRPLGRITKVFGPVREPFASVRTSGPAPASAVGSDVFVGEGKHGVQEGRRGRRSN